MNPQLPRMRGSRKCPGPCGGADPRLAAAHRCLHSGGYPCLWQLRCELVEDKLVLSGVVPTYYLKQLAQEIVRSAGTADVENRVEVRRE